MRRDRRRRKRQRRRKKKQIEKKMTYKNPHTNTANDDDNESPDDQSPFQSPRARAHDSSDGSDSFYSAHSDDIQNSNASDQNLNVSNASSNYSNKSDDSKTLVPHPTCIRNNRTNTFNVATVNARSVAKKMNDLVSLFDHANIQVACVCETWETEKMEEKLEELQEVNDITWVGKMRGSGRGGGAAVVVSNSFGSVSTLDVNTQDLEIVWAIITPHAKPHIKLVVAAFYSSPTKKYQPLPGALENHILNVIDLCSSSMKNVFFCACGDINMDSI